MVACGDERVPKKMKWLRERERERETLCSSVYLTNGREGRGSKRVFLSFYYGKEENQTCS